MDPIYFQYIKECFRQLRRNALKLIAAAAVISFGVLAAGALYQPKYETSITIYADNQNVIKPLLEGKASVTMPKSERIRIVREIMFSPRMLQQVIATAFEDSSLVPGSDAMEAAMKRLRDEIVIEAPADTYIKVSYQHTRPDVSYKVVNRITNLFIEESADNKRSESKSAYTFIDEQVKSYKSQLVEAENALKAFEAANVDGVESQVSQSINRLELMIDETAIDIEAEEVRIAALEQQLASENRYASNDYSARVYRERLASLESQLDTLLLNYRENHPDVVDLKFQIQDVKRTIVEVENSNQSGESDDLAGERHLNPIFEELSNQLAEAKVNVQTKRHRLAANEARLKEQYERRRRVAANQAQLSELTRDYDVTKNIYEDLLERKERARISMTLDLAGQGVTYKVLEPAVFPVTPAGVQFVYFAAAGPLLGTLMPIGLLVLFVLFDHRIRFPEQLQEHYPGIVLAVIPATGKRGQSWRVVSASLAGFVVMYSGAAIALSFL
ncbi:MAG: XrtA system polysaccharide chain length determinant [Pseudomonadota bacterium]